MQLNPSLPSLLDGQEGQGKDGRMLPQKLEKPHKPREQDKAGGSSWGTEVLEMGGGGRGHCSPNHLS